MLHRIIDRLKTECRSCDDCEEIFQEEVSSHTPCFEKLHEKERQNFIRLLRQTGRTLSEEEMAVVDEFLGMEGHMSSDFLLARLKDRGFSLDRDRIEDVLGLLCRYGLAQKVLLNGTGPWYEHLHIGENHDHLMCTRCGKVVEFYDEALKDEILASARTHGFDPLFYKATIYGICQECRDMEGPTLPLTMISPGETARIVAFKGGTSLKKRLTDMGLVCGQDIQVLGKSGPIILNVKGSRIAIGKGIAQKILVTIKGRNDN